MTDSIVHAYFCICGLTAYSEFSACPVHGGPVLTKQSQTASEAPKTASSPGLLEQGQWRWRMLKERLKRHGLWTQRDVLWMMECLESGSLTKAGEE